LQETTYISIVSPVYQGELLIELLVRRIIKCVEPLANTFEIILVNDGSTDNSEIIIQQIAAIDKRIKGIFLDKNYGQHIAIKAGLDHAKGEYVVVMDCDLQDQPEFIADMLIQATHGYDAVFARREKRHDSKLKLFYSNLFYSVLGLLTFYKLNGTTANFGIYSKSVIKTIINKKYYFFFFPLVVRNAATKTTNVIVEHDIRAAGVTTYSFKKALALAFKILFSNSIFRIFKHKQFISYGIKNKINFV